MALRKRPSAATSAAGHGIRDDQSAPESQRPLQPLEPPAPQPPAQDQKAEAEPAQHFSSSLKEQLAQQRAYAEQQQAYHHNPIFAYLAAIPGLSARQVHYLTAYFSAYPDRLNQQHWGTIADAHHRALAHGIQPDSDQYFHFVNAQLHQQPPSPPPMPPAPPPVPEPRPEHDVAVDIGKHEAPEGEEEHHMAAQYVSAPPSHHGGHSIEPQLSPSSVRLTAEQREVARLSMPHLSADEAEKTYAAGLLKQEKMKRAGLIK